MSEDTFTKVNNNQVTNPEKPVHILVDARNSRHSLFADEVNTWGQINRQSVLEPK